MPLPEAVVCPPPVPTPAPDPGVGECCDLFVGGTPVGPANPVPVEIAAGSCDPVVLATDTFTRADGPIDGTATTTGALVWADAANGIDIDTNQAVAGAAPGSIATITASGQGWVEADIVTPGGSPGLGGFSLLGAQTDPTFGGLYIGINGLIDDTVFSFLVNDGMSSTTTLSSIPVAAGTVRARIDFLNGMASFSIDGVVIGTAAIPLGVQASAEHGLMSTYPGADVAFDNLEVGSYPCGEPTAGVTSGPIESGGQRVLGAGGFVAPAGTQSVTVMVRAVGAASVTITTDNGSFLGFAGESYTWSVARDQDTELTGVEVTTTDIADDVQIIWTQR